MNLGQFVGFGTVRELVMGYSARKPTNNELELMKDLITIPPAITRSN